VARFAVWVDGQWKKQQNVPKGVCSAVWEKAWADKQQKHTCISTFLLFGWTASRQTAKTSRKGLISAVWQGCTAGNSTNEPRWTRSCYLDGGGIFSNIK